MRSSTSRCLSAARIRRITPRRGLSPPLIAAFMSSVMRALRSLMGLSESETQKRETAGAAGRGRPSQCARKRCSVQALAARDFAGDATQVALDRRSALALAFLGRLLVELALARFGEHAGLLAGALEAAQGDFERLVLADFDAGHGRSTC